jgi:hypothetical protein
MFIRFYNGYGGLLSGAKYYVKVYVRKQTGGAEPTHRLMEAWRDRRRHRVTGKEATVYYVFFLCFYTSPETGLTEVRRPH